MSVEPLAGVFAPVHTPFRTDLSIDKRAHLQFCKWLLANNVGLAIFGTNSEANSLSVVSSLNFSTISSRPAFRHRASYPASAPAPFRTRYPDTRRTGYGCCGSADAAAVLLQECEQRTACWGATPR